MSVDAGCGFSLPPATLKVKVPDDGDAGMVSLGHSGFGRFLCEPSQSGGFAVCLHWHHQTVFFSATSYFTGCRPVPCGSRRKTAGVRNARRNTTNGCRPRLPGPAVSYRKQSVSQSCADILPAAGLNARRKRSGPAVSPAAARRTAAVDGFVEFRIPLGRHFVEKRRSEPSREDDRRTTYKTTGIHQMLRKCLLFPLAGFDSFMGNSNPKATLKMHL